jgi:hypothetical protein
MCLYELVLTLLLAAKLWSQLYRASSSSIYIFSKHAGNLQLPHTIVSIILSKIRSYRPLFHVSLHKEHVAFRDKESDKQEAKMYQAASKAT